MAPPARPRIVIGLDVGKSAHWACIVTREGELLASRPIPNRENAIDGLYAQYPGALVEFVESSSRPHGKALKAVARKRLKVIYAIMGDKVPYAA